MRMQAIETEKLGPLTLEVHYDPDGFNPRTEWENFCKISYLKNRRGDCFGDEALEMEALEAIEADKNNICFPVYAMVHSGIALSLGEFGCPWDSGRVGVAWVTKEKAEAEFGKLPESFDKIKACVKCEIETFSDYLNGQVFGFQVKDSDGNVLDSCWGFIGGTDSLSPVEYVMSEAREAAKGFIGERYRKAAESALRIQDACNLSGVVREFWEAMKGICEEDNDKRHGTAWKNSHPIVTAFLSKLNDLNGYRDDKILEAIAECEKIAGKK